jgi:hypothetical protein
MDLRFSVRMCAPALAVLLLISSSASSQTTDIKVQIINSPPKAYDVYASPVVKSGQTDVVWCTAALEDLNSYKDIRNESAYVGVPSDGGYLQKQESDLMDSDQVSVIKGTLMAGFVLGPQATGGRWACVVEGWDNAGAKASNKTTFMVYPRTCGNKVQDAGEESIDCGGPCMGCSCVNSVQDGGEIGLDCGGPCMGCADKGALNITSPLEVTAGEVIPVQVNVGNKGMVSLVRVTKPSGKSIVFKTEDSGVLTLNSDETGTWTIQADMYGYQGAQTQVEVKTSIMTYVVVAIVLLAAVVLVLIVLRARKKG